MTEAIIVAIISSGILSTLIQGIFAIQAKRKKRHDSTADGVRILLYDKIKYLGRRYISEGKISTEDLEDLIAMHNIYHEMGGNGFLDKVMCEVRRLPLV